MFNDIAVVVVVAVVNDADDSILRKHLFAVTSLCENVVWIFCLLLVVCSTLHIFDRLCLRIFAQLPHTTTPNRKQYKKYYVTRPRLSHLSDSWVHRSFLKRSNNDVTSASYLPLPSNSNRARSSRVVARSDPLVTELGFTETKV